MVIYTLFLHAPVGNILLPVRVIILVTRKGNNLFFSHKHRCLLTALIQSTILFIRVLRILMSVLLHQTSKLFTIQLI